MQALDARQEKGKTIAETFGQVVRLSDETYKVRSQSSSAIYEITKIGDHWGCQCPDYRFRAITCKHIYAAKISFQMRRQVEAMRVIEEVSVSECLFCHSHNLKRFGIRRNKSGDIQRFICADCHKTFSINIGFEKMKHDPKAVTTAMQLYFSGQSLRNTQRSLTLLGVQVHYSTVMRWIQKYVSLMQGYVQGIQPSVSDAWRADEVFVKFSGKMEYVFALMDDETRFWIAQQVVAQKGTSDVKPMFYEGARLAGKNPKTLITDGAPNYIDGARAFSTHSHRINHVREIRLTGQIHNNKMERMNGEIRDREKVMRGLKNEDTAILVGMQIHHNFIRPHMGLGGSTPAEKAGIQVKGEDKWKTLIQNAAVNRNATGRRL
jgi:transposase-like protein